MTNNNLVPKTDATDNMLVEIDHKSLKHFFYMMHGEPTSRSKVFSGAIYVEKSDIIQLIDSLVNILQLAKVRDQVTFELGLGSTKRSPKKTTKNSRSITGVSPEKQKNST